MPEFYLEILDTSKEREDWDALCMHKLSHLTGDEIKALVPIVLNRQNMQSMLKVIVKKMLKHI